MTSGGGRIAIRQMGAADIARVLDIDRSLPTAPHWSEPAYLAALNPAAIPRRIALVAAEGPDDSPVGFAIASLLPPEAELETVAVAAEGQSQGTGRALLERLLAELWRAGVIEVHLESRVSNQTAMRLYRGLGFAESGRRSGYYADPMEDAVVMSLTIG
jgi:ribosomal-protein-alanine N-acetyltransferase